MQNHQKGTAMRRHFSDLEDDILEFRRATDGKKVSRRAFMAGLAALGLSPLMARLTPAHAQEPDLVLANWGGDSFKALLIAYVHPGFAANPN